MHLQVMYDPQQVDYQKLIQVFLEHHDPTLLNRQGGDQGTQYRSGVYFHNDEQKQIATKVIEEAASAYAVSSLPYEWPAAHMQHGPPPYVVC